MSRVNVTILACLISVLQCLAAEGADEVAIAFKHYGLVPDIIQAPPKNFLKVTYGGHTNVFLGNELTPAQVKSEPSIKWRTAIGSYYTLLMLDLDVPSRHEPTMRAINHWSVTNIPGNKVRKGEALVEYVGPGPGLGTGLHRYVFLLYRQPAKLYFREPFVPKNSIAGRTNFNVTGFALKYGLGEPIAGNFYFAQWDEFVLTIHKQLGITTVT